MSTDVLAYETTACSVPASSISDEPLKNILSSKVLLYHTSASIARQSSRSGLQNCLPSDTASHLVVPLFKLDDRLFVIIATISNSHYTFPLADINIIRSIGSILRAKTVQTSVLEADPAKTAFLSSISHELRTPMHAIMTGLDLLRRASGEKDIEEAKTLKDMTKSSARTLQNILNDVLEFGRNANAFNQQEAVSEVDLVDSATGVVKVCMDQMLESGVQLIIEFEDRDWRTSIDVARYNR